ncbi:MAG: hypothetical protein RI911_270 [Candidatus Parcubacteria bacterium]
MKEEKEFEKIEILLYIVFAVLFYFSAISIYNYYCAEKPSLTDVVQALSGFTAAIVGLISYKIAKSAEKNAEVANKINTRLEHSERLRESPLILITGHIAGQTSVLHPALPGSYYFLIENIGAGPALEVTSELFATKELMSISLNQNSGISRDKVISTIPEKTYLPEYPTKDGYDIKKFILEKDSINFKDGNFISYRDVSGNKIKTHILFEERDNLMLVRNTFNLDPKDYNLTIFDTIKMN